MEYIIALLSVFCCVLLIAIVTLNHTIVKWKKLYCICAGIEYEELESFRREYQLMNDN